MLQYSRDGENQLIQVDGTLGTCSSATACYVYDAEGKRVQKIIGASQTSYLYDLSGHVVAEDNGTSWGPGYVYAGGQLIAQYKNSTTYFVHPDHLGSTRLMTSMNQSPYDSMDYLPFGEQIAGDTGTTHKFTGKERDSESGLDNFGARYDSLSLGRWMCPDAINLTDERVQNPSNTLNKYVYGGNNPLKYIDPDGRDITVFYTDTGREGHFWMVAYDQLNGNSAVIDFGPKNGSNLGTETAELAGADVTGDVNYQSHMSADEMRQDYSSLTIQTNPEDAEKAIQAINAFNSTDPKYNLYGNNCTTVCRDVLKKILKLDSTSIKPSSLWADIFKNWSKQALAQPPGSKPPTVQSKPGTDFGQPRYPKNTFDFVWMLLHRQKACVTTFGPDGPITTCD